MALKTFHEQQRRFDQLARELIADGILEKGFRDPEKTACPGCGEHTRVSYTLAAQEVSCHTLHAGDKPGCGEAFTVRAAAPMHTLSWDPSAHLLKDPAERVAKCLRPIWHRDVAPDHPARSRYRELRNQFFHDIGIELN
jgi:hypothetical protein